MARLITVDNITSRDLKGFRKETAELIKVALASGWTGHDSSSGNLTLKGAQEGGVIHLSRNSRNSSGPLKQFYAKIEKFGDPVMVAAVNGAFRTDLRLPEPVDMAVGWKIDVQQMRADEVLRNLPPHLAIPLRRISNSEMDAALDHFKAEGKKYTSAEELVGAVIDWYKEKQEAEVATKKAAARHVVSEHPYLSHKNKGNESRAGRSYESKTVVERKWSDGTVDYACAFGDFEGSTPAKVTSHWRKHTRSGEVERRGSWAESGTVLVDDPSYVEVAYTKQTSAPIEAEEQAYSPREDRVQALSELMLKALDGWDGENIVDFSERLARQALVWQHDQQGNGVPREPETAEELLDRIRNLVDRGEYARMRQAALDAEQTADEALERAERAEKRNEKLKGDLGTLRDLLSSVGGDDE